MYETYSRIERLSEKIGMLADTDTSFKSYFDINVRQANLQYNLSWIISKVLVIADLPRKVTFEDFEEHLQRFNHDNSSNLTVADFTRLGWIRKINGALGLPSLVSRALRKINSNENIRVPENYELHIRCLSDFYWQCYKTHRPLKINSASLASIMSQQEISLLVEKGILSIKENVSDFYEIKCVEDTCRYIRNEISSAVWILLKEDAGCPSEKEKFLKFIEIIKTWLYFWPDNLKAYLPNHDLNIIVGQAVNLLLAEDDLIDDGYEFQKSWLDQPLYGHHNLFDPIPGIALQFATPFDTLRIIKQFERYYQGIFDHSDLRSFYHLLIYIIVDNDQNYGEAHSRYPNVISLMKDMRRPYVIELTYSELKRSKPEIFPYFLLHHELVPIALNAFSEIQFSDKSVSKYDHVDKYKALKVQETEMWKEAYGIFLNTLVKRELDSEGARALSEILVFQCEQFFYSWGALYQNTVDHLEAKARFEIAINKLAEVKSQFTSASGLKTRIFPNYLRLIFEFLKDNEKKNHYERTSLPCAELELASQILRLCNTSFFQGEISEGQRADLDRLKIDLSEYVFQMISGFFISETRQKYDIHTGVWETIKVKRGLFDFGMEIIEWGYIFLHLQHARLLLKFVDTFKSTIVFETGSNEGKYHSQNIEQYYKLSLFIKVIGIGVLQFNREFVELETISSQVAKVKSYLHALLLDMSVKHSINDLPNGRINVFDDRYPSLQNNLYHLDIADIVFTCFDLSTENEQELFLRSFFEDTLDLELLLNAYNIFESGKSKAIIAGQIQSINIQEFIRSRSTVTQLESCIIEAVNSDVYFSFALPIMEKVESHITRVQLRTKEYESFFFSIRLLLAFKNKDVSLIQETPAPKDISTASGYNAEAENKRSYFIGLHKLYNQRDFDGAITIFQRLITINPDDYEIRYRLFHANILKFVNTNDVARIILQLNEWNQYNEKAEPETRRKGIIENSIAYTSVIAYAAVKDYSAFDKMLDRLPNAFLYDEEMIPFVFQAYIDRELYEVAIPYLTDATTFYNEMDKDPPSVIRKLLSTVDDSKRVNRLRNAFAEIISLDMVKLLATIPEKFNGKRHIDEFLLNEIVRAGKIMLQKVKALDDISLENKYNDLLLAMLQFRCAVWGFDISDQGRSGQSGSGIDLGELDFIIRYAGDPFALIEAMILDGKNRRKTEAHILKIEKYLPDAKLFYVVTYYKGPSDKFVSTWDSYKKDVLGVAYPPSYLLTVSGFSEVAVGVDVRKIKVGCTDHLDGIKVYHLFFNVAAAI